MAQLSYLMRDHSGQVMQMDPDLFDLLAKKYTCIFVVGPALTHPVDTEILAAYAQGILVLLNGPRGSLTRDVTEFFQSLRDADAPLLGAVTFE